jgi:hypothetical protein
MPSTAGVKSLPASCNAENPVRAVMGRSSDPEEKYIFTGVKINKVFCEPIRLYYMEYVSQVKSISQQLLALLDYDRYEQ